MESMWLPKDAVEPILASQQAFQLAFISAMYRIDQLGRLNAAHRYELLLYECVAKAGRAKRFKSAGDKNG